MIKIVTVTSEAPFEPADDERVLERRADYNSAVPTWHLLVETGVKPDASAKLDAVRDARGDRVMVAFAAALVTFGQQLNAEDDSVPVPAAGWRASDDLDGNK